jgi:hypothetical protein
MAVGAVLFGAGMVAVQAAPAGATFPGNNGDLVWAAICNGGVGQQLWSQANTTTGAQCAPAPTQYNTVTAGAADSMPYFDSDGGQVYFSSNRATANNAIFGIPYPSTVTNNASPPPALLDNATQLTQTATSVYTSATAGPSGYDYAPTVAADTGGPATPPFMLFIHCATTATTTGCGLDKLSPVSASGTISPVTIASSQPVLGPTNSNGDGPGNRPEIDPKNSDLVLYVDAQNHIHEMSLSGAALPGSGTGNSIGPSDVDLSFNSGVATAFNGGAAADEHPDWAPDGQGIVFDSTRSPAAGTVCAGGTGSTPGANTAFTMSNLGASPTVAQVWAKLVCGYSQIEPVYGPADTYDTTAQGPLNGSGNHVAPTLAWVALNHGANIQTIDDGTVVGSPVFVTANATDNSEVVWQPVPSSTTVPDARYAVLLPAGGALMFGIGFFLNRRRRRAAPAA